MSPPPDRIRLLLFDVGGVLVELKGVGVILDWLANSITVDELWYRWLHSPAVRQFETGQIDQALFATRVIEEFDLPVSEQLFLESFAGWASRLYPGTLELLARIPASYQRALLSNSNALHWPRVMDEMGLRPAFHHHFVSFVTGRIKPDPDAFEHVLDTLGIPASQILFFDDNRLNVETAERLGLHARLVRGIEETGRALADAGILAQRRSPASGTLSRKRERVK
jgi:HAD superfamily hydrolase (TIGR01509 family)